MNRALLLGLILGAAAPLPAAAQSSAPDWSGVATEAMGYFKDLLRIDTSNPPGNETQAANYLRDVLARNGIESELFALDPARANLVARIRGNGSQRPILVEGLEGAGEENHRDMQARRVRLDLLTDLVPVLARHDHVADHHVGIALRQFGQELLPGGDGDDIEFRLGKCEFDDLLDGQAVVSE